MRTCDKIGLIALVAATSLGGNVSFAAANGADAPQLSLRNWRAPVQAVREAVPGFVWLEAEGFRDYGKWHLDTQFVHKMGSAYLLAAAVGTPVKDASTSFDVPRAGTWHAWARTKDWVPAHSPGMFALAVNGRESPVLGASGKPGWRWERAGAYDLAAGPCEVRLVDKSGWFGRCDAVLFTTDAAYVPPEADEPLALERRRLLGQPETVSDAGDFDVVVVGAGTTGMGAAIAAARAGARTALVQDRPVLGGNASMELGVGIHGASHAHPNARESGLIEEAKLIRAGRKCRNMSEAYLLQAQGETNLTLFLNERMTKVELSGRGHLSAVLAQNTLTGGWTRWRAAQFVDCTGDGWLGYYAGVPYRMGREGQSAFGEEEAPEQPDATTMSGVILGNGTWCFARRETDHEVPYETPVWARVLPDGWTRRLKPVARGRGGFTAAWWIEHAGDIDDFADPERARDELVKISLAYWGWGKNTWEHRHLLKNHELTWVPFLDARRETLRLEGAYILTGNDQKAARVFPDRISYGGWPMDTHDPLGMMNPNGNGYWKHHPPLPIYTIPYRILYNPDFDNLLFAGRCASVSHMALGSVRVEATLATLGQVCGTAAAICAREGLSPKALGDTRMPSFQQRLLKDDLYIPELANADPADLARRATVTASSAQDRLTFAGSSTVRWHGVGHKNKQVPGRKDLLYAEGAAPRAVIDGVSRIVGDAAHAWVSDAHADLPQTLTLTWPEPVTAREVRLTFDTDLMPTQPDPSLPKCLVKDYDVEVLADGTWTKVASENGNFLRHRVHAFPPRAITALRLVCRATWGDPSARVFEVRVY